VEDAVGVTAVRNHGSSELPSISGDTASAVPVLSQPGRATLSEGGGLVVRGLCHLGEVRNL
jgi:hypothetical protein